jgi:hypothetical protein
MQCFCSIKICCGISQIICFSRAYRPLLPPCRTGCDVTAASQRASALRRVSIVSLVTPATMAESLAGGRRGTQRYGNRASNSSCSASKTENSL